MIYVIFLLWFLGSVNQWYELESDDKENFSFLKENKFGWIVLIIISLCWPIILSLIYLIVIFKKLNKKLNFNISPA